MIKSALGKVMWGQRDTVVVVGLALIVALLMAILLAPSAHAAPTTFTVTSTADPGTGGCNATECTLREAIEAANANANPTEQDLINFDIPGSGVQTISPDSQLPTITEAVTINGYSQTDASPNGLAVGDDAVLNIELSGASAEADGSGLRIEAADSTVKGLVINRWGIAGILIEGSGATGNKVTGNYLGTDSSGTQNLGNAEGVSINGANNNTIGGATPGARNVISGNFFVGVIIRDREHTGAADGNKVMDNYIGTDKNGTAPLGNWEGVTIQEDADNNTIGGTKAGARNVISSNLEGMLIFGEGNTVKGNKVMGNYIGTDASGTQDLGNDHSGVAIVNAPNNTIGGTRDGARNIIAFNGDAGVLILSFGVSTTGNRVLSNSIFSTGGLGIDLGGDGPDGPTANDPGDGDDGPNELQNKPNLTSAVSSSGSSTIKGRLNSTPNDTFTIQFFANPAGTDEGKTFLGQKSVTTGSDGLVNFSKKVTPAVNAGREITATATDSEGNTSEFSAPETVQ